MFKKLNPNVNNLLRDMDNSDLVDVTESSSSDASPASMIPTADITLEKESDVKSLKQELYDLKLRIYYMERKNKMLQDMKDGDIYQKYVDLQTELEKLSKRMDEKDELLLKAQKLSNYLRAEKEKIIFQSQEKERLYKEQIQQLEKELEDMKLCNPKFGLNSTMFMSGDSIDSFSFAPVKEQKRVNDLEFKINQLNSELESAKVNNDQLEQTVHNLQRKVNLCNKEITELSKELSIVQRERDSAIDNCSRKSDLLNEMEREKQELLEKLEKFGDEKQPSQSSSLTDPSQSSQSTTTRTEKAAAAIIRHLLIENRQVNSKLKKVKEDLILFYEQCSGCPQCLKEKKFKKISVLNLGGGQKSVPSTSEDEKSETMSKEISLESESEQEFENIYKLKENLDLKLIIKEKDKIIKQLNAELRKRTYNLQELVNKELWDKNREIEKLNKVSEKRKHEIDVLRKQVENRYAMRELQPCAVQNYKEDCKENISSMSDDVKLLKEQLRTYLEEKKALLDKITNLENKIVNDEERNSENSLINNLRLECVKRKDDFEEAEKARKEAYNACSLLTHRLEELACFLETLLVHDFNGMNSKKRELLKQAIERSREISKTFYSAFAYVPDDISTAGTKFESSVDLSAPILPDYSEINLSFSGGEDDEDEFVEGDRTLKANDDSRNSVFDQMMRKSVDFGSTEDSDSCVVRRSISFINNLNSGNELVFSAEGVQRLGDGEDETENQVTDEVAETNKCDKCLNTKNMLNSVTASSAIVSLDEAPKTGDFDSESEAWSEPDRNVSAARIGLQNSTGKIHVRRLRPEQRPNTDSDVSGKSGMKYSEFSESRQLQKRIQHLEKINESLRKDLKYLRLSSGNASIVEKTDMEKIREKTKLRNLLNKINLENCVDTTKYRDYVEAIRRNLRDLSKHLVKTNKLDKFISLKLKEVSEYFEMTELCCSKLSEHMEGAKTRNDVLTDLLEETQSKFERVMVDLRTTKLAYNSVILEHEQNVFKYKQSEVMNDQLKDKLKSADELCRTLEKNVEELRNQNSATKIDTKALSACNCDQLRSMLDTASAKIAELEKFVATNDTISVELDQCKKNLEKLTKENERLLVELEELSSCKLKIEEYEKLLKTYRVNCEKLEAELFEKDSLEKICREQCAQLEQQILEKDEINRSLKQANDELRETCDKVKQFQARTSELEELVRVKENELLHRDRQVVEIRSENEKNTLRLREMKEKAEFEVMEKTKTVTQLKELLRMSEDKTQKFENEIELLRSMLQTCDEEKRDFRKQIATQMEEHESLKKQHEQKMKHLLGQIVAYRTEEESNLAAHKQLVEQIEEAQNKKELWKRNIQEWKEKYEELKKEKEDIEMKLRRCTAPKAESQAVNGATENGDVADTNKDYKVHHLENIKSQLETRVKELEKANRELEVRLQRLQTSSKVSPLDFELTSEESSRAASPTSKKAFPSFDFCSFPASSVSDLQKSNGYSSSSLPTSPSHSKCLTSPLASSVPSSPSRKHDFCAIPSSWLPVVMDGYSPVHRLYNNVFNDDRAEHHLEVTPARKISSENSATSPDLGIDSDHGRNSSFDFDSNNENKIQTEIINLEEENKCLKRELGQTKRELEDTLGKLTTLNKNKKRMEKAIFKQIFETKHILKRARVNLEDGSVDSGAKPS